MEESKYDGAVIEDQLEYRGYTIEVIHDPDPVNPRDDDYNLGTMICRSRKYNLGDQDTIYDDLTPKEILALAHNDDVISLPLYVYEHGGLAMSTASWIGRAHHAEWDSYFCGIIIAPRTKVRKHFDVKRISKKLENLVLEQLRDEVRTYDAYLNNRSFGYRILLPNSDRGWEVIGQGWSYLDEGDPNQSRWERSGLARDARDIVDYDIRQRKLEGGQMLLPSLENVL